MKNSLKVHSTQLLTSKMSDSTTFLPRYKKQQFYLIQLETETLGHKNFVMTGKSDLCWRAASTNAICANGCLPISADQSLPAGVYITHQHCYICSNKKNATSDRSHQQ
jgi:hypothetical protein